MSHYITDSYGNIWPVNLNLLVNLNQCGCGKDIPHYNGYPLCPHCKCYQGEGGCNDCECLEGEK